MILLKNNQGLTLLNTTSSFSTASIEELVPLESLKQFFPSPIDLHMHGYSSFGVKDSSLIVNDYILTVDSLKNPLFTYEFPVFGYELKIEERNPIVWDNCALVKINQKELNLLDIDLNLKFGDYHYSNVPIKGNLFINQLKNQFFVYQIEDPILGFFMQMHIDRDNTYIDIAFGGRTSQFCYQNLIPEGYLVYDPYFTKDIEVFYLKTNDFQQEPTSFDELHRNLINSLKYGISIYRNDLFTQRESTRSVSTTKYGIAHEKQDFSTVNLAEDLPDDFWEPYTEIDTGIYRRKPSESQIKSDLQYYNKDFIQGSSGYIRDIKAYTIYAHGSDDYPSHETSWIMATWFGFPTAWLDPSEIEDLWYHWENPYEEIEMDVYPHDMIIQATVCYGYAVDSSSTPYMAKAFVDNEAAAFMGATLTIPASHNDDFTETFWYKLCQQDKTIQVATEGYVNTHNNWISSPQWTYGTDIKIYGDTSAKLDN
jgi:hypothetical protein